MRNHNALNGPICRHVRNALLLFVVGASVCSAQTYSTFDLPNKGDASGAPGLSIRKANGEVLTAPLLPDQVAFSDAKISPDRHRVGWLALMPNDSPNYPIPLKLVIFKGDKIERVVDDGICIFGWTFENKGAEIAYYEDTLHFSTGKRAVLRDIASGKQIATFGLTRVDGEIPATVLARAPPWVRTIPRIGK